ncbi:UPAR/Ly6 domain-containing protein crok-like [Nomia melanderi]|uniref:UPAR/Ly6 domain-containing protein crok-like n=1 Tax=Nomia melanderi TaxID=2448451 RepID=UPI003FCE340E
MSSRIEWMLVIFGLVLLAQSGSTLQCWNCSSDLEPLCGDLINITDYQRRFYATDCDEHIFDFIIPVCRKIVKTENGKRVVKRECWSVYKHQAHITDGPCNPLLKLDGISDNEYCFICSTDLCNSATSASILQSLYVVTLGFVGYHFFQSKYNFI